MSQININSLDDSGDHAAAANMNLLTVLLVLAVLVLLAWAAFTGPLRTNFFGRGALGNPPPSQTQPKANPAGPQPEQQQIPLHLDQMRAFMLGTVGLDVL